MDFLSLIILNYFLTPILAFTFYFCFLHSIRHSISLIFELDKSFKLGLRKFISKVGLLKKKILLHLFLHLSHLPMKN